jgi:hypothetical protein
MNKIDKTLVFAGPTLSGLAAWRASHADRYVFHSPVRCGHVLEAYREGYRRIVIIDGLFERCPAVWHKEIMFFVDKGGVVVGCSSMGALRAVELEPFGMLGFGKVVADLKAGVIADDDEVTVAHLGPAQDYVSLTDAMVNIRYTVADAVSQQALDRGDAERILAIAKAAFYKKRSLALFAREALSGDRLDRFHDYLTRHGMIDQKRRDAIALLDSLDSWLAAAQDRAKRSPDPLSYTVMLQNLQYLVDVNPPFLENQALASDSTCLKMGRLLVGKQYHLLSMLAGAIMHYSKAIKDLPAPPPPRVPWLDPSWLDADPRIARLIAAAVADCPQYAAIGEVPMGVRYLALAHEFPIAYLQLDPCEGDALITNSVNNYSRLLYLIGLFVDARLCHDLLAQRLVPTEKATELRIAQYTLRGLETEELQREFLRTWGLYSLHDAAIHLERNAMLLSEVNTGVSFWFFEEGIYWYKLAIHAAGLWPQLHSLARDEVRASFSQELAQDLQGMSPARRVSELLMAGLPPDLLTAESISHYITSELEPS